MLKMVRRPVNPRHRICAGVIAPISEEVRDRVLEAARHIPVEGFGTTDDCGCSPVSDGTSTSREVAVAKIRAPVAGTALKGQALGKA